MEKSRPLVLVATMRSPTTGSPDHTHLRLTCAKETTLGERPRPDFPACASVPKAGPHDSFEMSCRCHL